MHGFRPKPLNSSEALWTAIRGPFKLPQCIHHCSLDDWELFDIDAAGCKICGRLHRCNAGTCRLIENEGAQVCEVTGFCVKNLVFADDEFVTTVSCIPTQYIAVRRTVEREQVSAWVGKAIASPEAQLALQQESKKRALRAQAIFLRLAKHYKSTRHDINIVSMCAVVQGAMQASRVPRLLPEDELEALVQRCTDVLTRFTLRFLEHLQMPQVKLHGFVIGLLYLLRTGIKMWDSVELLPMIVELQTCLPLESQLGSLMKLSTKIVTESENTLKLTFRNCSRMDLVDMGFTGL